MFTIPPAFRESSKSAANTLRAFDQLAPVDFTFLKFPSETKQTGVESQCIASKALLLPMLALIQDRLQIPLQMGPAELRFSVVIPQINWQPFAAQNARKHRAQQADQNLRATARRHHVVGERVGHQRPDPALLSALPPARFVYVQHRLRGQLPLQLAAGDFHGRPHLLPALLRAAQTDRDPHGLIEQPLHYPPRHPAHHGQVRHQRRQSRTHLIPRLLWQCRSRRLPATRTLALEALVLRDPSFDRRPIYHLMAMRLTDRLGARCAGAKSMSASAALCGQNLHGLGYLRRFHRFAAMSSMTYLPARSALAFAARLSPSHPLRTCQSVRTRRLGRVRGVPSRFRQFLFQLGDLLLLL